MHPDNHLDDGLLDWLSGLDEQALTNVLTRRPLLLEPPGPRRLEDIAARLRDPVVTAEAAADLTTPEDQFLRAVQLCRALGREPAIPAVAGILGTTAAEVEPIVAALGERALAWLTHSGALGVPEALDPYSYRTHHLGQPMAELLANLDDWHVGALSAQHGLPASRARLLALFRDSERMRALVTEVPADTQELLHDLAWNGPDRAGVAPVDLENARAEDFPGGWAMERGLLFSNFGTEVHLPLEVGLALRGPDHQLPFAPRPPEVPTIAVDPARLEPDSCAAALRFLDRYHAVAAAAATEPLPLRKTGQVGARLVNRLVKLSGGTSAEVQLALAMALHAELLEVTEEGTLVPSGEATRLHAEPPATLLIALLSAWWEPAPGLPGAEGDPAGEPIDRVRYRVLRLLGELGDGRGQPDAAALTARVSWLAPFLPAESIEEHVGEILADAELLGLVSGGALTALGRALVDAGEGTHLRTDAPGLLAAAGRIAGPGPAPYEESRRADPADLARRLLQVPAKAPERDFRALADALGALPENRLGPLLAGVPVEIRYDGERLVAMGPELREDSVELWDLERAEYRTLLASRIT
ncbi:hypothetical protein [Amycolatopsis magusensis]|uniref:hypothetical protein n=1 Tax=Amycolatopsis magusensis TaxID=882444 RepID=UPI00379769C8